MSLAQGDGPGVLWTPPADVWETTEIGRYVTWLERERGLAFASYDELQRWSVDDLEGFWSTIWDFGGVKAHAPYTSVLASDAMPGATWFPGARLNFAEHLVGEDDDTEAVAVVAYSQTRERMELSFGDLREQISRARAGLLRLGVQPGERVVAYMPNIPETLVAFAAAASIGAVWASCAPELGARSVVDRLAQLDPAVLLTVDGYGFRDRLVDRRAEVAAIRAALPSLRHVVHVPYGEHAIPDTVPWAELLAEAAPLEFLPVAFDHPLSVLFSSGTTGIPKAIVHGHGGILLEYFKAHALSWDLKPGGRLQWFTTTSWMMWQALVAALVVRSSIVMLDGDPAWPDLGWQWRLAEETRPTFLGVSPAFMMACRKAGLQPGRDCDLSSVRILGIAGSPLPAEGYRYVYEQLGPDVLLINGSGGTDVCSGIVGGTPLLPVYEGEISGRLLGVATDALRPAGRAARRRARRARDHAADAVHADGALGRRRRVALPAARTSTCSRGSGARATGSSSPSAAAASSPGAPTPRSTAAASGSARASSTASSRSCRRSSTASSCIWRTTREGRASCCSSSCSPTTPCSTTLCASGSVAACARSSRRATCPTRSEQVRAIPRTLTGKKLEMPVKRILLGVAPEAVASRDALLDPTALDAFAELAPSPDGRRG